MYKEIFGALIELMRFTWEHEAARRNFLYSEGTHWVDHLYKTKDALIYAMEKQHKYSNSVFAMNQKEMERFIFHAVLGQMRITDFMDWLMDPSISERVYHAFQIDCDRPMGYTLKRKKDGSYAEIIQHTVTIVLKKTAGKLTINGVEFTHTFVVFTAYPGRLKK